MLYTRGEIVQLVKEIAPEIDALLIAIAWFASAGDPNLVTQERYGLLQVDITQARTIGFTGDVNQLLDPKVNIQVAAQLIHSLGLIQFCGRAFATQIPAIVRLESELRESPTLTSKTV